eukprot:CAMPEP_0172297478 /NCGR_PEP_ID=MMETSP1058-20130122/487_1 /TAXON_ID=83371 /ORGANISM="Detonula confervacea, Strain CCMP 353" /LENGTH=165 /DNA_ID=CAMNT_0013006635 /DNA_START=109 /DNA_END=606 /DNA_ORIENTATION=-
MRPAPFDEEYTFDAPSGVRLVSTNNEHGGHSTDGVTQVFGADGNILYEMPVFTGRRDIYLSPDGAVIVLDGEIYYGPSLMRPTESPHWTDQVVTSVYLEGKLWRDIRYETDLNGKPVKEEYGGGWASRTFTLDVSWERNVLTYDMEDASEKVEISLPSVDWVSVM